MLYFEKRKLCLVFLNEVHISISSENIRLGKKVLKIEHANDLRVQGYFSASRRSISDAVFDNLFAGLLLIKLRRILGNLVSFKSD